MEATQIKNDEPFVKAEIDNMKVELGFMNYKKDGITSGEIEIWLPNGTRIDIQCKSIDESGDIISPSIQIFDINNSEITVFDDKVSKKRVNFRKTIWTEIKKVVE